MTQTLNQRQQRLLQHRLRKRLCEIAKTAKPVTYQLLAKDLELSPPNTIHQLTIALETLIEEDATADRPLIAALVISKARNGLPAPGFFECAKRVGVYYGHTSGPETMAYYESEFKKAVDYWCAPVGPLATASAPRKRPPI